MATNEYIDKINGLPLFAERAEYTESGVNIDNALDSFKTDTSPVVAGDNIVIDRHNGNIRINLVPVSGPVGPTGAAGSTGPQGPCGPSGNQGVTGSQGPCGPSGNNGPCGPSGNQGVIGSQGDTGDTGAKGPCGPSGSKGVRGSAGATGVTGAKGPCGPLGAQGPCGPSGNPGVTGSQGATGVTGAKGPCGPSGNTGAKGPCGPRGAGFSSISFTSNYTGFFTPSSTAAKISNFSASSELRICIYRLTNLTNTGVETVTVQFKNITNGGSNTRNFLLNKNNNSANWVEIMTPNCAYELWVTLSAGTGYSTNFYYQCLHLGS